jgi:hypothetical protein
VEAPGCRLKLVDRDSVVGHGSEEGRLWVRASTARRCWEGHGGLKLRLLEVA